MQPILIKKKNDHHVNKLNYVNKKQDRECAVFFIFKNYSIVYATN